MNRIFKILGRKGRITIPFELRMKMGFKYNDILSFTQNDENSITVRREKICSHCKADSPPESDETVTLKEFLDNLPPAEQKAALIHLSVKWAENKGGDLNA